VLFFAAIAFSLGLESVWATPIRRADTTNTILYDGRAPFNFTSTDLSDPNSPYLAIVKGDQSASNYVQFLGDSVAATPLWEPVQDQAFLVTIDNTSVFTPGNSQPQFGFRRTELIAQQNQAGDRTTFNALLQTGKNAFHFSFLADQSQPLNLTHEYQIVFIEPNDGTHVFEAKLGTPFNTTLSENDANVIHILSHNQSVLFQTPFDQTAWHNLAVLVDSDGLTLQVFYSQNGCQLQAVTGVEDNSSLPKGPTGQGDFHFGVLKLPLINPSDSSADQSDVAHHGIQEGTVEGLTFSGVFVEAAPNGPSIGGDQSTSR